MKRILSFIIITLLLAGCNQELKVSEVDVKKVNRAMQEIIDNTAADNGNYLIQGEKVSHLYLNRSNVIQGEEAIVLSNFTAEVKDNILSMEFSEEYTADYSNRDLTHELLYKIMGGQDDYDTISIMSDGESTSFASIIVPD